jgi:hypothetical protein
MSPMRSLLWMLAIASVISPIGDASLAWAKPSFPAKTPVSALEEAAVKPSSSVETVEGPAIYGSRLSQSNTHFKNNVVVGREALLQDCVIDGNLVVGKQAQLIRCRIKGTVQVGKSLEATESQFETTLGVGKECKLVRSEVAGLLTIGSSDLVLESSRVGGVECHLGGSYTGANNGVRITRSSSTVSSTGSSVVMGGAGQSQPFVRVGPKSRSVINGFAIQGAPAFTQVVTPQGYVYRNGKSLSSEGPLTYALYRDENPQAPTISGPAWPTELNQPPLASSSPTSSSSTTKAGSASVPSASAKEAASLTENPLAIEASPMFRLEKHSVVKGDVRFIDGQGWIQKDASSQIQGELLQGQLRTTTP